MDDPVRREHPGDFDTTGKKQFNWRGRMALAVLVLVALVGYTIMFLAFDLWYRG